MRSPDNATQSENLRPICVITCFYRTWTSARVRSRDAQNWTTTWLPPEAWGGVAKVNCYQAVGSLLDKLHDNAYLGSFDYSLAFDHINPYIVTSLFKHTGMPPGISKMIYEIWGSQRKWMQLYDAISATPACVTTSVPQGDAWAVLAMAVLLTIPWLDLKQKFPETTFALYVDDRTWCSPTAAECAAVANSWHEWSVILGLKENNAKSQFYHKNPTGREKLVAAGVDANQITSQPKILGVVLWSPATVDNLHRQKSNVWTLPNNSSTKPGACQSVRVASASAVSKASYGWQCRLPSLAECRTFNTTLARACRISPQSEPHLRSLLLGHHTSLYFRSAFDPIMSTWKMINKS